MEIKTRSTKQQKHIWMVSNILSGFLLLIIIVLWILINNRTFHSSSKVSSTPELNKKISLFKKNHMGTGGEKNYINVPTGIYIQSYEFVSTTTVSISGYVWQKVDKEAVKRGFVPGIVFPEATSVASLKKSYEYNDGNYRLVGWRFYGVSLLQNFNYSGYPWDIQSIKIRIWPSDFYHYIILKPDLNSYTTTKSGLVFGLENNINQQGFEIKETFFELVNKHYETTFGDPKKDLVKNSLELVFNIVVKRDSVNAFLINFIPILGIWSFLFAITMIISNDKGFAERVHLSTTQIFAALGGIIFSVILMSNHLRANYFDQPVLYMDYFYIITFFIIVLVSYDAYVITSKRKLHQALQHNIFPKTAFWPLVLGSVVIITVLKFFVF